MNLKYSDLIDSGLFSASLSLKQTTEIVTSHDGFRTVNSDYGHAYYMLSLSFRNYTSENNGVSPIDGIFALGVAERYVIPIGLFSEAILTHSNIRGGDERAIVIVQNPGATVIFAYFLSTNPEPSGLGWGVDSLLWGGMSLQFGSSPVIATRPEIDHAGRLFSSRGKIHAIVEDFDTPENNPLQSLTFRVSPPMRKAGRISSRDGLLQIGNDLLFTGRIMRGPDVSQDVDGWVTYKLTFVEDSDE